MPVTRVLKLTVPWASAARAESKRTAEMAMEVFMFLNFRLGFQFYTRGISDRQFPAASEPDTDTTESEQQVAAGFGSEGEASEVCHVRRQSQDAIAEI